MKRANKREVMVREEEIIAMRAIALCFKRFLKPEEASILCNLGRTQMAKKFEEFGIYKSETGYYSRDEIEDMQSGKRQPLHKIIAK